MLINPTSEHSTGFHGHFSLCPLVTYTWKSHRHHKFKTSTNRTNHFLPEMVFSRVPYLITRHFCFIAQATDLGITSELPHPHPRSRSDQPFIHGARLIPVSLGAGLGCIHLVRHHEQDHHHLIPHQETSHGLLRNVPLVLEPVTGRAQIQPDVRAHTHSPLSELPPLRLKVEGTVRRPWRPVTQLFWSLEAHFLLVTLQIFRQPTPFASCP